MKFFSKIRSLLFSIYFNFNYLPLKQAIKLPIFLHKPIFGALKGTVVIDGFVHFRMIELGKNNVPLYPDSGIFFQNVGGKIVFKGKCEIGNASAIAVGKNGYLEFGNRFCATAQLKIACQHRISFDESVLCGWETMIVDSDFHRIAEPQTAGLPYGAVVIGSKCWLSMKTIVLKNTVLPAGSVVAANSLLNKAYLIPNYLLAGSPAKVKKEGVFWNPDNDKIAYPEQENDRL